MFQGNSNSEVNVEPQNVLVRDSRENGIRNIQELMHSNRKLEEKIPSIEKMTNSRDEKNKVSMIPIYLPNFIVYIIYVVMVIAMQNLVFLMSAY